MQYTYKYESPLGTITMASDGISLTGLWFDGQKYYAQELSEKHTERALPIFETTESWLNAYFEGRKPQFYPPIALYGSSFRLIVWSILKEIPYGTVTTYSDIARETANRQGVKAVSAQAVGGAIAHNPISIIIPCHRVIGKNGSLTGYAGGLEKKLALLKTENVNTEKLSFLH